MQEAAVPLLTAWQNFYTIIGSASATVTGLMFVVVTLVSSRERMPRSSEGIGTFSTPSVVHLCTTLLTAAILSAPWPALWNAGVLLGICGLAGVIYIIVIIRRARRQTAYEPVLEDWLWHTILPFIAYAALVFSALVMTGDATVALFVVGGAAVLFLFIGIHNAWDNITYLALVGPRSENENRDESA